ncbi:RnfABCDGE type electron transport complex subunit G [Halonatronum saccharophilum]|uniref:RnfABCDGE type electron transport complex subunit G n=1 Tax=Halonatronum saccharophilum TaxID=150060 RepID=UPI00048A0CE2|nr:RnfABCDGE type electron transport complex subunit G [Halonatronum saccharophilum]
MAKGKIEPRLVIVLTIIVMCSAVLLSFVHQWTEPIIAEHAASADAEAVLAVLPEAEETEFVSAGDLIYYKGFDGAGNLIGIALQDEGRGYEGGIRVMVGLDMEDEKVLGIDILEHSETPGLGSRITEEDFLDQFVGKSFSDSFELQNDIDVISGATASSRGVTEAIKGAIDKALEVYGGGE